MQIRCPGAEQEVHYIAQAVFDRPETRTVAAALADVEGCLPEAAMLRVGLPQIGDVIHPALFRAGADIDVDALDGLQCSGAVFAPFKNVVNLLFLVAMLPAFAGFAGFTPAVLKAGIVRATVCFSLFHYIFLKSRPALQVHQRIHGPRVGYLIVRHRGGVNRAGPRVSEHLPFQAVR